MIARHQYPVGSVQYLDDSRYRQNGYEVRTQILGWTRMLQWQHDLWGMQKFQHRQNQVVPVLCYC